MNGYSGAGNIECILAIVPVKIKSKKSNKIVKTYAFIGQGSSTTFCTKSLMRELNLRGRKRDIPTLSHDQFVRIRSVGE